MNPHAHASLSPVYLFKTLWKYRTLIQQLTGREIAGRYKGSVMGLTWSFFNPIFMLVVYTFVFSEIFQSRWAGATETQSKTQFSSILFAGMIILNLFNEILNRAPNLILSNTNYVKKVVFPLEILPVICTGTALFHAVISMGVLVSALLLLNGFLYWTIIFFPLVLLPLAMLTTGVAWMLASLGVYLRDASQTMGLVTLILTFLSPVFYPVSAVPYRFQRLMALNPLTFIIGQARDVLIWGKSPDWAGLSGYSLVSLAVAWTGYVWFQKTRRGFADVL